MKKITLKMQFGRVVHGDLKEEFDRYYQVVVSKIDYPENLKKFKKVDWQKGDIIKISKDLILEVSYD